MKKILLTAITALASFMTQAQWLNQNLPPLGYDGYINDMEVTDVNTVWANTQDGSTGAATQYTQDFVRTIDGGNTWTFGSITGSPAANNISNIWPIDANTCYVAMYGTTPATMGVWKTTDGGVTWNEVGTNMFTAASSFTNVVYFWDAQNGMAFGDPSGSPLKYEVWLTNDAGATWNQVPGANLPALTNNAEYGITNLFSHAGGSVWFGTTYGDIYRSIDNGNTWTKAASGLPAYTGTGGRQDITDIAFTDANNGIALQINGTGSLVVNTTDGGLTWNSVTPAGSFYITDIDAIPGTNMLISAGSSGTLFGTSYSTDNGASWLDIDIGVSHTGIDFLDLSTGWTGEFIQSGGPGGAWKFTGLPIAVPCGSPQVSPGTTTVNDNTICFGDTLWVTTNGALAPTDGTVHGWSILISSADISGNNDPLNSGFILGSSGVASNSQNFVIVNDGVNFLAGVYYFTPVVYGNATGSGQYLYMGYTLDPNCTNTGVSVMVELLVAGDPNCTVGIEENNNSNAFGIKSVYPVPAKDRMNVTLNSNENGTVKVSVKDFLGKEVLSNQLTVVKGENNLVLDISNQTAGVYFLTITGSESTVVSKFVKN